MPDTPASPILAALYNRDREAAERLAGGAALSIWEAAALGRDQQLRALLAADSALAGAWAPDGFSPLALAAFFAGASTVKVLLDHGASVDAAARNEMRVQPLHAAVAARNQEVTALLLERGADPNARQQVGYTPLMGAAGSGLEPLVSLLLARGADPSLVSDDGKTAASIALEHGHQQLAETLFRLKAEATGPCG